MFFLVFALVAAFACTLLLVRYQHKHASYSVDPSAVQSHKVHRHTVTRIGGLGILLGLLCSWLLRLLDDANIARQGLLLLLCALPCFAGGLLEDISKRGWIATRLTATLLSAALAGVLLDGWLTRLDVPWADSWMGMPVVSMLFTCVAVAGVINAFNLIDGFNGLAAGVAIMILLALGYVGFKNGDILILAASLTSVGAILGFMLWNFPRGLIYLGDCGAYLLGFWVAELSVLLVVRNPQVSAWFPLVLCSYPVFETLFSIYRRTMSRGAHPTRPDAAHLHHMIYRRLVRWAIGTESFARQNQRNSLTSPYLWILTSVGVLPAVVFWRYTIALQVCTLVFAVVYVYGYARIVRFRAPRWWVIRKK